MNTDPSDLDSNRSANHAIGSRRTFRSIPSPWLGLCHYAVRAVTILSAVTFGTSFSAVFAQDTTVELASSAKKVQAVPSPDDLNSDTRYADAALRLALSPSLQKSAAETSRIQTAHEPELAARALTLAPTVVVAAAEPSAPLNTESTTVAGLALEEFEAIALANSPAVRAAAAAVAAAQGAAIQAGLPPNPSVGYEGQQIGSGGRAEQDGVMVTQEFVPHVKRNLSRAVALREMQMAQQRYEAQRVRVLTDVRIAFYRVLRAQRQIDATRELVDISRKALSAAQSLFDAKEVARTDVLQAQIEVDVAEVLLANAYNLHQSVWSQLATLIADPTMSVQTLAGDLFAAPKEIDFESAYALIRSQSPELCEASINVQRARTYLQRQLVEPRPNVGVQGLYNFRDEGIGGGPDGAVGISVPVPIWNRNQGAIQEARYQVSQAEQAYTQLELSLRQRLAPVFERYSNAKVQVSRFGDRILPAAAETLELTRRTFTAGEISFTNLLIAQRTYSEQKLQYLDSAEALRLAETEIDGLLLSGSLNSVVPQK